MFIVTKSFSSLTVTSASTFILSRTSTKNFLASSTWLGFVVTFTLAGLLPIKLNRPFAPSSITSIITLSFSSFKEAKALSIASSTVFPLISTVFIP